MIATTAAAMASNAAMAGFLRYPGRSGNQNASGANGSKLGSVGGSVGSSTSSAE